MFEVGKTYRADGQEFLCIFIKDGYAWLSGNLDVGQTAYVWTTDGKSYSLSNHYDIVFDNRDKEIEELKRLVSKMFTEFGEGSLSFDTTLSVHNVVMSLGARHD